MDKVSNFATYELLEHTTRTHTDYLHTLKNAHVLISNTATPHLDDDGHSGLANVETVHTKNLADMVATAFGETTTGYCPTFRSLLGKTNRQDLIKAYEEAVSSQDLVEEPQAVASKIPQTNIQEIHSVLPAIRNQEQGGVFIDAVQDNANPNPETAIKSPNQSASEAYTNEPQVLQDLSVLALPHDDLFQPRPKRKCQETDGRAEEGAKNGKRQAIAKINTQLAPAGLHGASAEYPQNSAAAFPTHSPTGHMPTANSSLSNPPGILQAHLCGLPMITIPMQDFVNYIQFANAIDRKAEAQKQVLQELEYKIRLGDWITKLEVLQKERLVKECDILREKKIVEDIVDMWKERATWDTDHADRIQNWLDDTKAVRNVRSAWRTVQVVKEVFPEKYSDGLALFNWNMNEYEGILAKKLGTGRPDPLPETDDGREPPSATYPSHYFPVFTGEGRDAAQHIKGHEVPVSRTINPDSWLTSRRKRKTPGNEDTKSTSGNNKGIQRKRREKAEGGAVEDASEKMNADNEDSADGDARSAKMQKLDKTDGEDESEDTKARTRSAPKKVTKKTTARKTTERKTMAKIEESNEGETRSAKTTSGKAIAKKTASRPPTVGKALVEKTKDDEEGDHGFEETKVKEKLARKSIAKNTPAKTTTGTNTGAATTSTSSTSAPKTPPPAARPASNTRVVISVSSASTPLTSEDE